MHPTTLPTQDTPLAHPLLSESALAPEHVLAAITSSLRSEDGMPRSDA